MAPTSVPAATPSRKPQATRHSVASAWRWSSPVAASSLKVCQITDGGGTRRPLESPLRTASSHAVASTTGSSSPSAGRTQRASDGPGGERSTASCGAAVMEKRDTAHPANATRRPSQILIRGRHITVVDQIVDRLLHVHAWADHACLLQCDAGLENGFALRGTHLVIGELGALLELLVNDRIIELCNAHENLLELAVVG